MTGSAACGRVEIATSCVADCSAGAGVGSVGVVDHGEVGGFGAIRDLDPHGRAGGIAGETDVALRVPGERGDLDRCARHFDAGARTGKNSPRANTATTANGTTEARDLETQHDTPTRSTQARGTRGLWLAERKENSLPPG